MVINSYDDLSLSEFENGATILVDKPLHWTSFDVVNKLRFLLKQLTGVKKLKVGHAGTLDPLATGLLIISIGKDTRLINTFQEMPKVYTGTFFLGATTASFDREFEPDLTYPVSHIDNNAIDEARSKLTGEIYQTPPSYSAIKINGEKAYKKARNGEEFVLKERKITIFRFDTFNFHLPFIDFRVECQKGTYIRTLAYDFGKLLNSGAYLYDLRREGIGDFHVNNSFKLPDLIFFLENLQKN